MPNDAPSVKESIQALIDAGSVSHRLKVDALDAETETKFLRAVCELVTGSIYRSEPFDYYIQVGENGSDLCDQLLSHLAENFEGAEISLTQAPEAEEPVEDSPTEKFDASLNAGAIMFAQSNDPEKASAVVSAEFANQIAKSTADKMAKAAIEVQDNAIIPRLDAIEMRFEALEAAVAQSGPGEIEGQLDQLSKSLELHAERLEGNLTQDRLDTLISLVSASGKNEPETAISNERLATAIETLLQTMQETLQPEPALMDPYFKQLQLQSEGLIKAITKMEQAEADVASLSAQLSVFRTMAEAAPKEGSLSAAEKMETLEEISSGLSGLMNRILGMVGHGSVTALSAAPDAPIVDRSQDVAEALTQSELVEEAAPDPSPEPVIADETTPVVSAEEGLPAEAEAKAKAEAEAKAKAKAEVELEEAVEPESEVSAETDIVLDEATPPDPAPPDLAAPEDIADEPAATSEVSADAAIAEETDETSEDPAPEPVEPAVEPDTEESTKLVFEPAPEPDAPSPTAKSSPTEEELDRRVEELLKSPRLGEAAPPLQQKTG